MQSFGTWMTRYGRQTSSGASSCPPGLCWHVRRRARRTIGLLLIALPAWQALVFVLIHKAATGMYLGLVFAPNHKGMLITEHDNDMDFLHRQVLTARNVYANPFVDAWYGGLNYQIEHHLFPSMPRSIWPRRKGSFAPTVAGMQSPTMRLACSDHTARYWRFCMISAPRYGSLQRKAVCLALR